MKRLLAVLFVLALCVVGFGFYRGWFALSSPSPPAGSSGVNINLSTDTDKIKADAETAKDKAREVTGNVTEDPAEPADRPTDEVPPNPVPTDGGPPSAVSPNATQPNGN